MSEFIIDHFDNIEINPEFKRSLSAIQARKNVLITGKAGTGKSTLLRLYRDGETEPPPVIAPTGIAALNVDGTTIHKYFGFRKDITPQSILDGEYHISRTNKKQFSQLTTLIIDEISMVRADLFDCISHVLEKHGPRPGEPFGGVQMLLFGDLFQLDPVVTESEEEWWYEHHGYKTKYFFSARAMDRLPLETIELDKVYRQKDREFIELLNSVRCDQLSTEGLARLNERVDPDFDPDPSSPYIVLTTTNARAERINSKNLEALDGRRWESEAVVTGDIDASDWGNIDSLIQYKVGAKVIMTNNDPLARWVNGTVGLVTQVDNDGDEPRVLIQTIEPAGTVDVYRHYFEITRVMPGPRGLKRQVLGTITQFPFKLAWAITVHRSQGQTLSHVIVDPHGGFFADGHLYVALSRCTSFDGLRLSKRIRPTDLKVSAQVARYLSNQAKRSQTRQSTGRAFIGVKTTDFKNRATQYNKVIEIAAVIEEPDGRVLNVSSLVAPLTDVGSFDQHRISPGDLSLAPTLSEVWPFFARRLHGHTLIAFDLDDVLRSIRRHLKSENVLIPMVDGVCLEELSSMSFEDACLDEDCVLERGHTALDVAETTAELCDAYAEHIPVVAEFDGSRQFDKPARLLARDSSDASDVSSKLIEMFGRAGTTQLETETCYRDMVAWMCAPMAQGGRMVTSQLAAARSQLGVSQRTASQVHVELVESLTRAAQRDARVHQDERDFIETISTLLRVDCPIVASPDVTHAVSLRKGMKVYFSGSFINSNTGMKIPKSTLRESAKDWGLENVDGVTKKNCDLLVVYDVASMSRSAKAARKWEIPVLSMEDFLMMIDCEIPGGS